MPETFGCVALCIIHVNILPECTAKSKIVKISFNPLRFTYETVPG